MKRNGWSGIGVLAVLLSAARGGLAAHYIVMSADQSTPPVIQWGVITVFILPVGFTVHLWNAVSSIADSKGLSGSERRRIEETIQGKTRQLIIAIMFYAISAVVIAIGLLASPGNWFAYQLVTVFTGMSLGISIASMFLMLNEWRDVSAFKRKLANHGAADKARRDKLEKLTTP